MGMEVCPMRMRAVTQESGRDGCIRYRELILRLTKDAEVKIWFTNTKAAANIAPRLRRGTRLHIEDLHGLGVLNVPNAQM